MSANVDPKDFLEPGCGKEENKPFPTFTAARPSLVPLRRPAGLRECEPRELNLLVGSRIAISSPFTNNVTCTVSGRTGAGERRPPTVSEREVILGFPVGYTQRSMAKSLHGSDQRANCRLTLLGNTWCVPVIAWLLSCLVTPLCEPVSLQTLVDRCCPGKENRLQSLLLRPPLRASTITSLEITTLIQKLCGLVSVKGEDLLLQQFTSVPVKFHRLRASIPAKLWRWATVTGWRWRGDPEHINVLELRAAMTCIRYRVEELGECDARCVHLVDSLVVLHSLSRGRSSSRKMRRTLRRLNSLLLVSGLQPTWAYVDTGQNPADKPSRRPVRKPWVKVKRK